MFRILILLVLALVATNGPTARAETAGPACPTRGSDGWTAQQLFGRTADWPRDPHAGVTQPQEFPMTSRAKGVAGREAVEFELKGAPVAATFLAAARTNRHGNSADGPEYEALRARVTGVAQGGVFTLRLEAPQNRGHQFGQRWLFAVAVCDAGKLVGYGLTEVAVNPRNLSMTLAFLCIGAIYLACVFAAMRCNSERLQAAWREAMPSGMDPAAPRHADGDPHAQEAARLAWNRRAQWKLLRVINPVFVSQDASGFGSFGRLQLLIFSFTVGFVALNVFLTSGTIVSLGKDVLTLLGISIGAAGLSRVVPTNTGLSTASRLWIAQRRVLMPSSTRMPQWQDIVSADGEIDVTRVQAVIFTLLIALALLGKGVGDLSNFAISPEVQYLLGLSQVAYLAGKAIPSETVKRLNDAIMALRDAEAVPPKPGAAPFEQARTAAASAFVEVYGERFRDTEFAQMQPREPLAAIDARAGA